MKFGDFLVRRREQMFVVAGLKPSAYIRAEIRCGGGLGPGRR